MDSERQKLLVSIFETTTRPIFACDLHGSINARNMAATDFLGYSEKEIIGSHFTRVIHRELQAEALTLLNRILNGKRAGQNETILISQLKQEIPVSLTISPVYLQNELIGISFSCWEI